MARSKFKIMSIEQNGTREELYIIKILVQTKIHNIDTEFSINALSSENRISTDSINITQGGYNLLARVFLLKDVNELHRGLQQLVFRINNSNMVIKEGVLSRTWEQFADSFVLWAKELLNKLCEITIPVRKMLE